MARLGWSINPPALADADADREQARDADGNPRTLGDFRLFREIGRGGMAIVYEAEQISLRRRVALKVLPCSAVPDNRTRERFQLEARAAALLHHTHIVPVYAVGSEGDQHYYAMQLIEGPSLAAVIRELRRRSEDPSAGNRPDTDPETLVLDSRPISDLADGLASGHFGPEPGGTPDEGPPASSPDGPPAVAEDLQGTTSHTSPKRQRENRRSPPGFIPASSSSPDLLNNLGFTLQITGPHELQFASTQDFSYLNNSQYVFFGDSTDQHTSSPGGTVTTTSYTNDNFVGTDSTFSGNPVSLSASSGQVLLASLSLNAAITNVGDTYTISLVPPTGNGSISSSMSTFFDDFNFSTGTETSAVPFTSTPGTVKIISSAIPEPSTIVSGLSAVLIVAGVCGMRRLGAARGRRRPWI
jgi:hypothetical protein